MCNDAMKAMQIKAMITFLDMFQIVSKFLGLKSKRFEASDENETFEPDT